VEAEREAPAVGRDGGDVGEHQPACVDAGLQAGACRGHERGEQRAGAQRRRRGESTILDHAAQRGSARSRRPRTFV
jgi:hypothetical protein